jgi:crossover junction endodeoxyribonuclease RusA
MRYVAFRHRDPPDTWFAPLMEISFPIEFLVHGTPVSLQAKRSASKTEWKDRVKKASMSVIPQPHFAS